MGQYKLFLPFLLVLDGRTLPYLVRTPQGRSVIGGKAACVVAGQ